MVEPPRPIAAPPVHRTARSVPGVVTLARIEPGRRRRVIGNAVGGPGGSAFPVASLVDNQALRRTMGRAGFDAVADRTWENVGDDLLRHYAWANGPAASIRAQRAAA